VATTTRHQLFSRSKFLIPTVLITPCWPVRTMRAEALFSDKALNDLADGPAEDCQILCSTALLTINPPATGMFCHLVWQSSETKCYWSTEYSSHQHCLSQPVGPYHNIIELGLIPQVQERYWAFRAGNVSIYLHRTLLSSYRAWQESGTLETLTTSSRWKTAVVGPTAQLRLFTGTRSLEPN